MSRLTASQTEKFIAFKTAYKTISYCQTQSNYIAAYVIAFSLIEDRIRAMFVVRRRLIKGKDPTATEIVASFSRHVRYLVKYSDITPDDARLFLEEAKKRNQLMHAAMWNMAIFTEDVVDHAIKLSRQADRYRTAQKKKYNQ